MFFHLVMPAEVELHPRHFGPTMRSTLEQKLTREVHNQPPIRWPAHVTTCWTGKISSCQPVEN
jgi:hypothetical protein